MKSATPVPPTPGQWSIPGSMLAHPPQTAAASPAEEYTGGSSSYYIVEIKHPTTEAHPPYIAECNDIIEALGMNYAEGNAFKAIWRSCAAKALGKRKKGYADGKYDAEKVEFFGHRMVLQAAQSEARAAQSEAKAAQSEATK